MKIAFCFLTLSDVFHPRIWDSFFADAPADQFSVYCHPKDAERVVSPLLADRIISQRVPTRHGHVSIVEATLALFAAAYGNDPDNQYFILVSESTIPIVPFVAVRDELEQCASRSLVHYSVPPPGSEHHARLGTVTNNAIFAKAFYFHDQWIVLHRRHVGVLLEQSYLPQFAQVFAADEHYIMNVLVHARRVPLDQFINRRTTFVNWQEREIKRYLHPQTRQVVGQTVHPKTYQSLAASDLLAARNAWLFRKVAATCDCGLALARIRRSVPHR